MLPSGPAAIPVGCPAVVGSRVSTPDVVMRPIAPGVVLLVNHRFPSGPAVMSRRLLPETGNSFVTTRAVVTRPILSSVPSANQSAPSGPE